MRLKNIKKLFIISVFISAGLCALIVLLTWLYGVGVYGDYVNALPQEERAGHAVGFVLVLILWVPSSVALGLNFVAQLFLGINCASSKNIKKGYKRVIAIVALCIFEVLSLVAAFLIALTLNFMKYPLFTLLAVFLALFVVFKTVFAIFLSKNENKPCAPQTKQ